MATPSFNPGSGNIYPSSTVTVTISTTTSGSQIRYTLDGTTPTSTYGTLINGSTGQTSTFNPGTNGKTVTAIAFKSGYTNSNVNSADYWYDSGMSPMSASSAFTSITYSVWDGDWAILEEYDKSGNLVEKYLQGYHGLVRTFQTVAYYYQDELGSTSHIANTSGALLESYRYNLYGAPTYWNASGTQINASAYGVKDLHGGARWMSELGLYDDRNRFMSPDLGRFLQPDPIGFKGDASNLYRYCGNDWSNRADPMGLLDDGGSDQQPDSQPVEIDNERVDCSEGIREDVLRGAVDAQTAMGYQQSGGNNKYYIGTGQGLAPTGQGALAGPLGSGGQLSVAYIIYGGKWTEEDKKNLENTWDKRFDEWNTDTIEHVITPKAGGFNISNTRESWGDVISRDWSRVLSAIQGSGNFERMQKGDNTAANKVARDIAKQEKLNHDQMERFHDIDKRGMSYQQMRQLARDIKAGNQ